jgi:hypothetical protein
MAFTRFHDDPYRIQKQLEESSYAGRYFLDKPGQGVDLPFVEDPQIRMQGWGSNLRTNTINLESDLLGLTRPLNRDLVDINDYQIHAVSSSKVHYRDAEPFVQESRATHPAWMFRDIDRPRWENPLLNPLNGLEKQFQENISTRILEKDYYVPKVPVVNGTQYMEYYLTGKTVCGAGNCETNVLKGSRL